MTAKYPELGRNKDFVYISFFAEGVIGGRNPLIQSLHRQCQECSTGSNLFSLFFLFSLKNRAAPIFETGNYTPSPPNYQLTYTIVNNRYDNASCRPQAPGQHSLQFCHFKRSNFPIHPGVHHPSFGQCYSGPGEQYHCPGEGQGTYP